MIQAMIRGVTDDQRSRSRWATFAGWHRTEQLWREIYTRAVSALIAALVIYLVAALTGVATRKPLPLLCLLGAAVTGGFLVAELREARRTGEPPNKAWMVWCVLMTLVFLAFAVYIWVKR